MACHSTLFASWIISLSTYKTHALCPSITYLKRATLLFGYIYGVNPPSRTAGKFPVYVYIRHCHQILNIHFCVYFLRYFVVMHMCMHMIFSLQLGGFAPLAHNAVSIHLAWIDR